MMVPFIVYKPYSGESCMILRSGVCSPNNLSVQADPLNGEFVDDKEADPALHYVVFAGSEAHIRDRPALAILIDKTAILANGVDAAIISYLPTASVVVVNDVEQVVSGSTFTFKTYIAGTYVINITSLPHLVKTYMVIAT